MLYLNRAYLEAGNKLRGLEESQGADLVNNGGDLGVGGRGGGGLEALLDEEGARGPGGCAELAGGALRGEANRERHCWYVCVCVGGGLCGWMERGESDSDRRKERERARGGGRIGVLFLVREACRRRRLRGFVQPNRTTTKRRYFFGDVVARSRVLRNLGPTVGSWQLGGLGVQVGFTTAG